MNKKTREEKLLKDIEKANELHAQIYGKKNEDSQEQPKEKVETIEKDKSEPIVQNKVEEPAVKPVQQPIREPVVQPSLIQEPIKVEVIDKPTDFKVKYDTLVGKYNAEIPRYKDQLKDSNDEIKKLKDTIVSLEQRKIEQSVEQSKAITEQPIKSTDTDVSPFSIETTKYLKSEDNTDYGEGIVDLVIRGANEVAELKLKDYNDKITNYVNNRIRQIEQKIAPLEDVRKELSTVKTVQYQTVEDKFYSDLADLCPDWQSIRDTNEFVEWVNQPSPESMFIRRNLLERAANDLDSNRVAALYNAYIKSSGISSTGNNEDLNKPYLINQPMNNPIVEQPIISGRPNAPSIENLINPSRTHARENELFQEKVPPNLGDAVTRIARAKDDLKMRRIGVDDFNKVVQEETGAFYKDGRLVR